MRKKTAALMVLLLVMASSCYVTSASFSVAPGASLSLYDFLYSFLGSNVALADPVGGTGNPGGDD